jgi:ankyrin repeat protein
MSTLVMRFALLSSNDAHVCVVCGARVPLLIGFKEKATALHRVATAGLEEMARVLLKMGCNPTIRNAAGYTPLHSACVRRHVEVAALLLEHESAPLFVNLAGDDGQTALHWACRLNCLPLTVLLLKHGADRSLKTKVRRQWHDRFLDVSPPPLS